MDRIRMVCELGINHQGSLDIALQLIDMAHGAGADTVKFQVRTPELSTPKHMWNAPRTWLGTDMTYLEYKKKIEFGQREYDEIDLYCRRLGIEWTASVWDLSALEFLSTYNVPWIKLPSAMLTNLELIKRSVEIAPVVVSTGMSTYEEIGDAVAVFEYDKDSQIMHAHSCYPAPDSELSLRLIKKLEEWFGMPVGYSSHSSNPYPAIYAGLLGANMVEVHCTLDRAMEGTDHASSLEKSGLELLRRELDRIPLVMANDEKRVWDSELPARLKLRGV